MERSSRSIFTSDIALFTQKAVIDIIYPHVYMTILITRKKYGITR